MACHSLLHLKKRYGQARLCDPWCTMHPHAFAGHQGDCIVLRLKDSFGSAHLRRQLKPKCAKQPGNDRCVVHLGKGLPHTSTPAEHLHTSRSLWKHGIPMLVRKDYPSMYRFEATGQQYRQTGRQLAVWHAGMCPFMHTITLSSFHVLSWSVSSVCV